MSKRRTTKERVLSALKRAEREEQRPVSHQEVRWWLHNCMKDNHSYSRPSDRVVREHLEALCKEGTIISETFIDIMETPQSVTIQV